MRKTTLGVFCLILQIHNLVVQRNSRNHFFPPSGYVAGHKQDECLDKLYSIEAFDTLQIFTLVLEKKYQKTGCSKDYWLKVSICYFIILCFEKTKLEDETSKLSEKSGTVWIPSPAEWKGPARHSTLEDVLPDWMTTLAFWLSLTEKSTRPVYLHSIFLLLESHWRGFPLM